MNPNKMNDIIPNKKSIRNIPIPEKRQNKIDELLKETEEFRLEHNQNSKPVQYQKTNYTKPEQESTSFFSKWKWLALILILLIIGSFFIFNKKAEVNVVLKSQTISVDTNIAAVGESSGTSTSGTILYKVLPVQKEGTKEVNASGQPVKIDKKASGTIIVYNNHSTASQQLIPTTRFETGDGLVYRIDTNITVPGIKTVNGQKVPGSVEVVVYADQPGEKYNVSKADLTIPGFKGTPKFEGFYARTKTALSGGFSGSMPQVSDQELADSNNELKSKLTENAISEIQKQTPDRYVFFKEGIRTTYISSLAPGTSGKATVTGKVSLEALIFVKSDIESLIANENNGEMFKFDNLSDLTLSILNQNNVGSFISLPALSLKLSGSLTTGQSFDVSALKVNLADKSKDQLQSILKTYPEITKAEATIRPFWSSSFPDRPEKIEINVTKEN